MTVSQKEKQVEKIVERVVVRVLQKALKDPDFGLELRESFKKRIQKSVVSRKAGRLKNFDEVVRGL